MPGAAVESVTYPSRNETVRGVLYRPSGSGPFPAVVVLHEDCGLTDWVKEQARRLRDQGYLALAVDLYRGQVVNDVMDAHILERGLAEDRVSADLKAAVDYLVGRSDVRADALGVIGWDMGGGYALDAAVRDPRLRAAVVCYGRLTTDPNQLQTLQAAVLGIFAGKDEGIPLETIDRFQSAMKKAGKRLAVAAFPAAGSTFMDPESPSHTGPTAKAAITEAWQRIEHYLADELTR